MPANLKTVLKVLTSLLVMVGFLYFAFKGTDFEKLAGILSRANYWWALAMLPLLVLSHMLRAWRWEYMLRPVKPGLRYRNLFSALMVGYMMNNVLPKAGELVRPYAIGKLEGISRSAAFGTVLVERIFDILSLMLCIILIPFVYSGPLTQALPWLEEAGIWLTSVTFAIFALLVFLMLRRDIVVRMLDAVTKRLPEKRARLVEHVVHSFLDGFLFMKETRNYLAIAALSAGVWILYIFMMYCPFFAFGMTEHYSLDLGAAMVVQGISSIGIVIPTPGAAGPYHYFTVQTLTRLYGVDGETARSYAAVTHAVGMVGITLIGLVYFLRDKLHMADVMKAEPPAANVVAER